MATDALDTYFDGGWVFHTGLRAAPQLVRDDLCQRGVSPLPPPLRHPHGLLGQQPDLGLLDHLRDDDGTSRGGQYLVFAMPVCAVGYALVPPDVLAGALVVLAIVVAPVLGVARRLLLEWTYGSSPARLGRGDRWGRSI